MQPEREPTPGHVVGSEQRETLTQRVGRGATWQFAGAGFQAIVQLASSAILARVLFPSDFGILGMAVLAQGLIARIGAFGTATGVVAKKDISQDDLSTAFWTGVAVQGLLFAVAFAAAPLAANFFRTPEVTLVMRAMSVMFLFAGAGAVSSTLLAKDMRFGELKLIECGGFLIQSVLAVTLAAVAQLGYWALVLAMIVASFVTTIATIVRARWTPSFVFNRESFRFFFRFGINDLGYSIVNYFYASVDYIIVGRVLGPGTLGLYEFAYRIPHMVFDRVAIPVGRVLFPALSILQGSDDRIARGYIKTTTYIALFAFPALGGLAVVARPAVCVLWGEKWLPIVFPLQLLCFNAALRCVLTPAEVIFLCKHRPDLRFKFGLVQLAVTLVCVSSLSWFFGLPGIAFGMVLSSLFGLYVSVAALRLVHASSADFLKAIHAPGFAALGCMLASVGLKMTMERLAAGNTSVLLSVIPVGAIAYCGILFVWYRDQWSEASGMFHLILGRRHTRTAIN